jgi:hypothetical protein
VVEGIVGIEDWEVTVEGFANHAGTTPMNLKMLCYRPLNLSFAMK